MLAWLRSAEVIGCPARDDTSPVPHVLIFFGQSVKEQRPENTDPEKELPAVKPLVPRQILLQS